MKYNLLHVCAFFMLLFTFSSCKDSLKEVSATKESDVDYKVENGRLVFKDQQVFTNVLNGLVNKGNAYWNEWESKTGFTSYRRSGLMNEENEIIKGFGFPAHYATLLDKNQTYQVGETIVFFDKGYQYFIPKKDEQLLLKLKNNENVDVPKYKLEAKVTEVKDKNARIAMGTNSVDARYQHQWITDGGGNNQRKTVYEIATVTYGCGSGCAPTLLLLTRIKLYWKNSKGQWLPMGETTEKRISNLSYSFTYTSPFGSTFTRTGSGINVPTQVDSNNLEYVIENQVIGGSTIYAEVAGTYFTNVTVPYNTNSYFNEYLAW